MAACQPFGTQTDNMTRDELKQHLEQAAKDGMLMTPKHDPQNLTTTYPSYRTVLSHDLAQNLDGFISSGQYSVKEYENKKLPSSPLYFEIAPSGDSTFSVPASGVAPNSPFATSAVDRIIAVSGHNQGWHIFGESSSTIQQKLSSGDLDFKGTL
jgi:hypothetical protein